MALPGSAHDTLLASWTAGEHTAAVVGTPNTHPTYRKGSGPGVIVVHEIPGLTQGLIGFGEELVDAGYTVVLQPGDQLRRHDVRRRLHDGAHIDATSRSTVPRLSAESSGLVVR